MFALQVVPWNQIKAFSRPHHGESSSQAPPRHHGHNGLSRILKRPKSQPHAELPSCKQIFTWKQSENGSESHFSTGGPRPGSICNFHEQVKMILKGCKESLQQSCCSARGQTSNPKKRHSMMYTVQQRACQEHRCPPRPQSTKRPCGANPKNWICDNFGKPARRESHSVTLLTSPHGKQGCRGRKNGTRNSEGSYPN